MSAGNRLTKEELRSEVKEYLIALREERVQRSMEVKERLRQLRHERIERLHDVRTSLAVMESMRLKAQLEDSREDLRDRVRQLREDARSMLKQYSETRKKGFANVDKAAEELVEVLSSVEEEIESIKTEETTGSGGYASLESLPEIATHSDKVVDEILEVAASTEDEEEPYQNILSRVVTGLRGKEGKKEKRDGSAGSDNSLMGRIRRLANGEFQSPKPVPVQESASKQQPIATPALTQQSTEHKEVLKKEVLWKTIDEPSPSNPADHVVSEPEPVVVSVGIGRPQEAEEISQHDLLDISGIGPSVLKRLERIGICTLQDLASTDVSHLERSFGEYSKLADLSEWISDARLRIRAKE